MKGLFLTSQHMFPFCAQISFIFSVFRKIDFARFIAKRKRNTLKGIVKGSLRKKQFVETSVVTPNFFCISGIRFP